MKEQNSNDITTHRRRFGAGETGPTIARLRAKAYRDRKREARLGQAPAKSARHFSQHARGLLNLGRQYDVQARDNFAKEAVLFCVLLVFAVAWPAILSLRALAG